LITTYHALKINVMGSVQKPSKINSSNANETWINKDVKAGEFINKTINNRND